MAGRRFCPGAVAATPGGAWVVDHELPVVAFADAQDLSIEVVGNWFEECVLHDWAPHREIVTAVVGAGDECWVASPHAGGVIRLSRGGKSVYRLPAPVRTLAAGDRGCWALLDLGPLSTSPGSPPLWHLDGTDAQSFDPGIGMFSLAAAGGAVFALAQIPGDADRRLAAVRVGGQGQIDVIAEYEIDRLWQVSLYGGRAGPWVEADSAGTQWPGEHWVEPLENSGGRWRPGHRVALPLDARPISLDGNDAVWARVWADDSARDFDHPHATLRQPLDGSADSRITLPGQTGPITSASGHAWLVSTHQLPVQTGEPRRSLFRLSYRPDSGIEVARVPVWPDLSAQIPRPRPPQGVDPTVWAESKRAGLQAELAQEWTDAATGQTRPFIEGATIESVSLERPYPQTELVITFRLRNRPGQRFGRKIRCFDALGSPNWTGDAALSLMEDVASGALPPLSRAFPSADGVILI